MDDKVSEPAYDLEERTFRFAEQTRSFIKRLPNTIGNLEDGKQLVRSSGSIGANYIEANEALSRKDFKHRIRIARKESKESQYWLRLLDTQADMALDAERDRLIGESRELLLIFAAIIRNTE